MSKKRNTVKMLIVFDETGGVVSAAYAEDRVDKKMNTAIEPLPGQRIIEVEVPREISKLSGRDLHFFLSQIKQESEKPDLSRFTLPKFKVRRKSRGKAD